MKQKVTIHDLAKQLNITASTVSRALNNHPRISAETKKLVQKTAKAMGYSPNVVASNLRTGKTKSIGLIVPRINRTFFSDAISGIESITSPAGYNLIICQSDESLKKETDNLATLLNSRVDGVIISLSSETQNGKHLQPLLNSNLPLVQFDRTTNDIETDQVINDNSDAAYKATLHLIEKGFKHIAHFAGNLNNNIYQQRLAGYKKALEDNGYPQDESLIFYNTVTREQGIDAAQKILEMSKRPNAIFSASDYSAVGAFKIFKEAGVKIPDEMGIFGFANEPFTDLLSPSLSTVEQHAYDMGRTAAKLLIEQLSNNGEDIAKSITIKSSICLRESTNN